MKGLSILSFLLVSSSVSAEWPQGAGPSGDFESPAQAPTYWSVANNENIAWKITLPETGQSTPVISAGKVFFTTMKEVETDSEIASDIVAWCCDAATGNVLWRRDIAGKHPLRISGAFSDSSSPPAVCDGKRVVFVNASGTIACFDMAGNPLWSRELLSVGRTLPFLSKGKLVYTRQMYPPTPDGKFPHIYADVGLDRWTQLHALDVKSGKSVWVTDCGVNMGCAILPQKLEDGREVALVGRGGGHSPPEKPEGVSLVDLSDGSTLWTLPLEGFMSTQSNRIRRNLVHVFHKGQHLSVDVVSGQVKKEVSMVDRIPVRKRSGDAWIATTESFTKVGSRILTQGSNLLIGKYHYFRSYIRPYLGRVNVDTGAVEYLELPLQLSRDLGKEELLWYVAPRKKGDPELKDQAFAQNDMMNSRGYVVFGDKRSMGNGWGHIASPSPSVAGDNLYVPIMSGTVYVIRWNADKLDENAIVAINDLGPVGRSWTRASISFSGGRAYAHTIRELICIGK